MRNRFAQCLAAALWLLAGDIPAFAQAALLQAGPTTSGHVPAYVTSGAGAQPAVIDSGPAGGGGQGLGLAELLLVARGTGTAPFAGQGTGPFGTLACAYDAPTTNATGYHYLCFSPNATAGAVTGGILAYGAGGAASQLPLVFNVNGTSYQFPFVTSGVVGPNSSTANDVACWNNTAGTLLKDCGVVPTSVANSDGTLTISPTTGAVVASLALGHANTWSALQTFGTATVTTTLTLPDSTTWTSGGLSALTVGATTVSGLLRTTYGVPTIASGACGATTNGAIVGGSTNQAGQITIGGAITTTCVISFSTTLASAPNQCTITPMNATAAAVGTTVARVGAPTTTNFTITGSNLSGGNYGYFCL